jgi:hypothetical protein
VAAFVPAAAAMVFFANDRAKEPVTVAMAIAYGLVAAVGVGLVGTLHGFAKGKGDKFGAKILARLGARASEDLPSTSSCIYGVWIVWYGLGTVFCLAAAIIPIEG